MPARTGAVTPITTPATGEEVYDPDRGYGVVTRTIKGSGGACWVRFGTRDDVYYSLRTELGRWLAFPGPADASGLQGLE